MSQSKAVPSILVAEDDLITRDVLCKILSTTFPRIHIYSVEDGRAGVELFKEHKPDIVITDISMPFMDGIQMAGEIKAVKGNTKFIVLTAYSGDELLFEKFKKIGFSDYLSKPIVFGKLFAAVEKCINELNG